MSYDMGVCFVFVLMGIKFRASYMLGETLYLVYIPSYFLTFYIEKGSH